MKRFALLVLLAVPAVAQTVRLGDVNMRNVVVVTNEQDSAAMAALYGTNTILEAAITNEAALRTAHTEDTGNPHDVTAAQIGAATIGELADVEAALAAHAAYWPPNATDSSWFTFTTNNNEITITGYNIGGGADVVIPDYINGLPVTAIGELAFSPDYGGMAITSVVAPQVTTIGGDAFYACTSLASVSAPQATTIGNYVFSGCSVLTSVSLPQAITIGGGAFGGCGSLTSVSLPQVTTIGENAFAACGVLASVSLPQATTIAAFVFNSCTVLTSISLPQVTTIGENVFNMCQGLTSVYFDGNAPTIGTNIFAGITPPPTVYVTNPQATGWGAELGGMPVVRQPLYADAIYQAGELVATTGHVAQAIAAIPAGSTASIYTPIKPTTADLAITSTNDIYRITTSTAVTVTPDLSELTPIPANKIARWEVWLDCTGTNALDSTWDSAFDWSGSEPDLTVTGCYKFACSVVSGGKISIKQTYPTVYDFTRQNDMGAVGGLTDSTNATMMIALAVPDVLTYCVVYIKNNVSDLVYAITAPAYSKVGQSKATTIKEQAIPTTAGTIVFMDKFTTADSLYNSAANAILLWSLEKTGTMDTSKPRCWAVTRPANELEIKAYEAGWRP